MNLFFIRKDKLIKILLITLVIINFFSSFIIFLWSILVILYLFLYRKNNVDYKEVLSIEPDVVLSPVTGRVIEVLNDVRDEFHDVEGTKIRVAIPFWGPFGLFMPVSGTLNNYENYDGASFWRYSQKLKFTNGLRRFNLSVLGKLDKKVYLEVLKCRFGSNPKLWIEPGDKGKLASCIGLLPLGGTLVVTVPKSSKVLCEIGDNLVAGETVISGFKE